MPQVIETDAANPDLPKQTIEQQAKVLSSHCVFDGVMKTHSGIASFPPRRTLTIHGWVQQRSYC